MYTSTCMWFAADREMYNRFYRYLVHVVHETMNNACMSTNSGLVRNFTLCSDYTAGDPAVPYRVNMSWTMGQLLENSSRLQVVSNLLAMLPFLQNTYIAANLHAL